MKKILLVCAALAMGLTCVTARAANVTGTWVSEMKTPNGDTFNLWFDFKQDGATLTGTVKGPQGDPIAISDGKVDGDKISFKVSFNGMTINHEGMIGADEIKLTTKSDSADFPGMELILKRPPPTPPPPAPAA